MNHAVECVSARVRRKRRKVKKIKILKINDGKSIKKRSRTKGVNNDEKVMKNEAKIHQKSIKKRGAKKHQKNMKNGA